MKGVILAGGLATRLYPLTYATNKHLLPVYEKPMGFYPINTLVNAGIKDVLIVTSGPHSGQFISVLKNGKELGVEHLEYAYQENPKGGIADALLLAEDFADENPITVILGDNTTDADITKSLKEFHTGSVAFLKKVPDPERFGVAKFDPADPKKIIEIVEKPGTVSPGPVPSEYASTGLYIFDYRCFDVIKKMTPSNRGELEVTDIQNFYAREGSLTWYELGGYWLDAGTFDALFEASAYWAKKARG